MDSKPKIPDWRAQFKRLEGAYAPKTMKSYYTDVEIFVTWCESKKLAPFPAHPETFCGFLEAQATDKAYSTIRRRFYAVRKAHALLGLRDPTAHEDVRLALRRIKRAKHVRPRQARGLTRPYLDMMVAAQPDTPLGLRNRLMLCLGYELLTRRSELIAIRTADLTWRADGSVRVLIRSSKSDPFGEGRIGYTSRQTGALLSEWLAWRGLEFEYLFCPVYKGHQINRSLSTSAVKKLINNSAKAAGLDTSLEGAFSGHSMRVGAAQDLFSAGHDMATIMRAGGWKSVGVLVRYVENAERNVWD